MKVWITKYALTAGIKEIEAPDTNDARSVVRIGFSNYAHGDGREWHRTLESAVAKAQAMQAKKIVLLKKQLAVLEAKRFA